MSAFCGFADPHRSSRERPRSAVSGCSQTWPIAGPSDAKPPLPARQNDGGEPWCAIVALCVNSTAIRADKKQGDGCGQVAPREDRGYEAERKESRSREVKGRTAPPLRRDASTN